ncbi:hypothetical protein ACFL2B_02740 [Patescibacteria group bacterium]
MIITCCECKTEFDADKCQTYVVQTNALGGQIFHACPDCFLLHWYGGGYVTESCQSKKPVYLPKEMRKKKAE